YFRAYPTGWSIPRTKLGEIGKSTRGALHGGVSPNQSESRHTAFPLEPNQDTHPRPLCSAAHSSAKSTHTPSARDGRALVALRDPKQAESRHTPYAPPMDSDCMPPESRHTAFPTRAPESTNRIKTHILCPAHPPPSAPRLNQDTHLLLR